MADFVGALRTPFDSVLLLAASEKGLTSCNFVVGEPAALALMEKDDANARAMRPYIQQFEEYFEGKRTEFEFPLDLKGTDFEVACWYQMRHIPYGTTRTYAEIADRIGLPGAARAVGTACGKNRLAIVISCHRVVGKKTLGGYRWGEDMKQNLLALEAAQKKI